jgi:hypothetical protein
VSKIPSAGELHQHVIGLWGGEDEIEWCARAGQAFALRGAGIIRIAPIKGAISYATALHEIGHIHGRHQDSRSVMVRERWAWKWARANALIWTPAMERSVRKDLAWYAPRAAKIDRSWAPE